MNKEYSNQYSDPRWVVKAYAIKKRDNYKCRYPGCDRTEHLNVHHLKYKALGPPWDVPDNCLITYCPKHHAMAHGKLSFNYKEPDEDLINSPLYIANRCANNFHIDEREIEPLMSLIRYVIDSDLAEIETIAEMAQKITRYSFFIEQLLYFIDGFSND